jgi:hypothetical protein
MTKLNKIVTMPSFWGDNAFFQSDSGMSKE